MIEPNAKHCLILRPNTYWTNPMTKIDLSQFRLELYETLIVCILTPQNLIRAANMRGL